MKLPSRFPSPIVACRLGLALVVRSRLFDGYIRIVLRIRSADQYQVDYPKAVCFRRSRQSSLLIAQVRGGHGDHGDHGDHGWLDLLATKYC